MKLSDIDHWPQAIIRRQNSALLKYWLPTIFYQHSENGVLPVCKRLLFG